MEPVRPSALAEGIAWVTIVLFALIIQVVPFILILTLTTMAFGVSSIAALIIVPGAFIGMVVTACVYAARRRKALVDSGRIAPMPRRNEHSAIIGTPASMLPFLRRQRYF